MRLYCTMRSSLGHQLRIRVRKELHVEKWDGTMGDANFAITDLDNLAATTFSQAGELEEEPLHIESEVQSEHVTTSENALRQKCCTDFVSVLACVRRNYFFSWM